MAARLPGRFNDQNEKLDAQADLLEQRINIKAEVVKRLAVAINDQAAVMAGYLPESDPDDRNDERVAYRTKVRRMWRADGEQSMAKFLVAEANEQSGADDSLAKLLAGVLDQIAIDESTTRAQLLIDIGAVT